MLLAMRATLISASGVVLKTLMDVLEQHNTEELLVARNTIGDSFLFEPTPDFVVGVLSSTARDTNQGLTNLDVMFRIGRSVEREIPTLLIVPPPLQINSPIAGVAIARCPTDNAGALTIHVSTIIATATARYGKVPQDAVRLASPGMRLNELIQFLNADPALSPIEFESIVREILANDPGSRSITSQSEYPRDGGIDAILSPADAPGQVILVQAKMQPSNLQRLARAEFELQEYVTSSHASLGLLVLYDREARDLPARSSPLTPLVVSVSLKSLAEQLLDQSLLQVLVKATAEPSDGGDS
jgi:Restriction endonuclease